MMTRSCGICQGSLCMLHCWLKHLEDFGVITRSCGSYQGVLVQVTGLVITYGGSWDDNQVMWNLPGVVVQVAGLVTTYGGS